MYMNLAQQVRGIDPLLDSVFSFLRRKTDFFTGPPNSANGSEVAVKKVMEIVNKHKELADAEKLESQKKALKRAAEKKERERRKTEEAAAKAREEEDDGVIELGGDGFDASTAPTPPSPPPAGDAPATEDPAAADVPSSNAPGDNDDDDDDNEPPPPGNGGTVDGKYVWTQTLQEVGVTVAVPKGTRGRDLKVKIGKNKLTVQVKGSEGFEGDLCKPVICDDSFWTLEDNER